MKSKILVVDDENDLRQLLAAVLGEHYDVGAGRQRRGAQKALSAAAAGCRPAGRETAGRRRPGSADPNQAALGGDRSDFVERLRHHEHGYRGRAPGRLYVSDQTV